MRKRKKKYEVKIRFSKLSENEKQNAKFKSVFQCHAKTKNVNGIWIPFSHAIENRLALRFTHFFAFLEMLFTAKDRDRNKIFIQANEIKLSMPSQNEASGICRRRCDSTLLWKGYFKLFWIRLFKYRLSVSIGILYAFLSTNRNWFFTDGSIFAKEKDWALVFVFKFNSQLRDLSMKGIHHNRCHLLLLIKTCN